MENSTTSKVIVGTFVGLLAICLTWAIMSQKSKISLRKRLGEETSKSEALVAEKLLVEKALNESKDSNNMFISQRAELDEALEHRSKMLTTQTRENKRIEKALRFAEQQRETDAALSNELKLKLDSQRVSYSASDGRTRTLLDSINKLKTEHAYLENELNEAIMTSIDQTVVSAVKRNDLKFTSKARAAKKLIAKVEVPGKLKDLRFVLEGPSGEVVSGSGNSIAARVLEDDKSAVATTKDEIYPRVQLQNIELMYVPEDRLKTGTYTFKIFNGENYFGSMMVNLR
jgi:hypothetical protein